MSKTIYIGGRLESKEKGNVVTGANAILDDTKGKKQNVINKETDDELLRLEQSKQDNLNFDSTPTEDSTNPVTSGGVYTAEKALSDAIEAILLLIPSAATALNKLVDTNTMNSSISTATATFRGTYNAVSDLGLTYQATHAQIEAALDALGLTADNNDFTFVQIPVSDQSQDIAKTERFKFNGTNWLYEYDLNTSGFTAAQWAAINSGITVALVTKLTDLPTAAALQLAFNGKQDTLTFDTEPTALSQNPVTSGGIYTAIQAVATALSDYSTATDGRLDVLEGLIPTEASSSNKLTDKAYVDGLIQAITELIPAEADTTNQLADKAYVLAQILAATPAFKGQFVTLAELQAVASPKAGDLGIVRTKDSDGMDVFTVYQYLSNAWNVFYSLSYHPQTKPATTGTTGDYPYNGMGRVELAMNMVNTGTDLDPVMVNTLTQDMFYKGAVGSRVPNTNTIFVIRYDYVLGENITIPDNCVLEFEGGSIGSNDYSITGNNCIVEGNADIKCTISGLGNESIKVSWFVKNQGNAHDTLLRAFYCATNSNCRVLDGGNETIDVTGQMNFDATNGNTDVMNLSINFTATANNTSLFHYDEAVQYRGHYIHFRDCSFTQANPNDYSNVHCFHLRRWDSTTGGYIRNVNVFDFTGYMFLCESYLQEFEFNLFKGVYVGGFISFNKEYGTANAFGDYGYGSSNIIRFINSGFDNGIRVNNTITDLIDLTNSINSYFENCVFQGNISESRNQMNISAYGNYVAEIRLVNMWLELYGADNYIKTGDGCCLDIKGLRGTIYVGGTHNTISVVGEYPNIIIEDGMNPVVNISGVSYYGTINDSYRLLGIRNKCILNIKVNGKHADSRPLLYKKGWKDDMLQRMIFGADGVRVTTSTFIKDGIQILRQEVNQGASNGQIYISIPNWNPNVQVGVLYRLVYRVYPTETPTAENIDTFQCPFNFSDYIFSTSGDSYQIQVGQSTNPDDNEWNECVCSPSIIKTYANYAKKIGFDIAVCELYYGEMPVDYKITINPSNKKELLCSMTPVSSFASQAPTDVPIGFMWFNGTKPLWYKGNNVWVDATGATV